MFVAGVVFLLIAAVFAAIGIAQWRAKDKPVGFFSNAPAPKAESISDIPAYNKAHARGWLAFTAVLAAMGLWALTMESGSTAVLLWGVFVPIIMMGGVIALLMNHITIENKYKKK